jgi:phenylacetic acid degradation operon negative regulatory protein
MNDRSQNCLVVERVVGYFFIMKAKTELLLYQLLWLGEQVTRPTFRNLTTSFEAWSHSSGLLKTINRLENQEFLEIQGKSLDRVICLTEKGRQLIVGRRNPETEWARQWDGIWRMVLFDIPETDKAMRNKLRRILSASHFGCLQRSVWLSPHPMDSIDQLIRKETPGLACLSLMECRQLAGEKSSEVVRSAWDFPAINAGYETYIQHLKQYPSHLTPVEADRFVAKEKQLWESALKSDPLFPKQLIPAGYKGKKAWRLRNKKLPKILAELFARQAHTQSHNRTIL